MQDLTFAGLGYIPNRPFTFAWYIPIEHKDAWRLIDKAPIRAWFGRRAPWIYYSRNISTTNARP
jgi:hypothetical protein